MATEARSVPEDAVKDVTFETPEPVGRDPRFDIQRKVDAVSIDINYQLHCILIRL